MLSIRKAWGKCKPIIVTGLDIGTYSVKALQLSRMGDQLKIESYSEQRLPPNTLLEKDLKRPEIVTDIIKQFARTSGKSLGHIVLGLPDKVVINKVIQLEATLNDAELAAQILLTAEQYIPYPLADIQFDFQILNTAVKNNGSCDVLLVLTHKEQVERWAKTITASGLAVAVIDVESFALERVSQLLINNWPQQEQKKTIALLNIGAAVATLVIFYDRTAIFIRHEMLSDQQSAPTYLELLLVQLRRWLQFFFSSHPDTPIDHLVLAGGGALLPGLAHYLQEHLGINVTLANPFANVTHAAQIDSKHLTEVAPKFVQACGLALHNLERK